MPAAEYSASAFAWAADSPVCAVILQVAFVASAFAAELGEQPRALVWAFGVVS